MPTTQSTRLLPANLDLEHVSQYNDHGKALVPLLEEHKVSDCHHPLVLGLFAVHNLLVSLGHFSSADISWAPLADFRCQDWLEIGSDPEVADFLEPLPYLQDDMNVGEPIDIAHDAPALSYLGKANPEYRGITEISQFLGSKDIFS
jgi:hypothetical protein